MGEQSPSRSPGRPSPDSPAKALGTGDHLDCARDGVEVLYRSPGPSVDPWGLGGHPTVTMRPILAGQRGCPVPEQRYPDWDPRSWSPAFQDPPTGPIPTGPDLDSPDELTPIFDSLWAINGMSGRHALNTAREAPMPRHGDDDADGLANQSDPDWRPDARDGHAHDDESCDQHQEQPDRWVGVTRDPDELERHAAEAVDG